MSSYFQPQTHFLKWVHHTGVVLCYRPVHMPSIFTLEIVERARMKTAGDLLTASPRGWLWGKEETCFFGASPSFSCSELALMHSLCSHARRFSKRKRKQRLVQANTTVDLKFKHYINHTICVGSLCCQRQRSAKRRNTKYISLLPKFCLYKHIF